VHNASVEAVTLEVVGLDPGVRFFTEVQKPVRNRPPTTYKRVVKETANSRQQKMSEFCYLHATKLWQLHVEDFFEISKGQRPFSLNTSPPILSSTFCYVKGKTGRS
jgi:hypothetical protein